jgi:hypothetical protein
MRSRARKGSHEQKYLCCRPKLNPKLKLHRNGVRGKEMFSQTEVRLLTPCHGPKLNPTLNIGSHEQKYFC